MSIHQIRTPAQLRAMLVHELRRGPLDMFELAERTGEPPYRIRGELKQLKRDRLAVDARLSGRILWRLTEAGMAQAWERAQLRLEP